MKKKGCMVGVSLAAALAVGLTSFAFLAEADHSKETAGSSTAAETQQTAAGEMLERLMASNSADVDILNMKAPNEAAENGLSASLEQETGGNETLPSAVSEEEVQSGSGENGFLSLLGNIFHASSAAADPAEEQEAAQESGVSEAEAEAGRPQQTLQPAPTAGAGKFQQTYKSTSAAETTKPQQTLQPTPGAGTSKPQQTLQPTPGAGTTKPQQTAKPTPGAGAVEPQTAMSSSASSAKNVCVGSNHVFISGWTVTKQPTCADYGSQVRSCQCGKTVQSSLYGKPTGRHQYVHKETAPSCDKDGSRYDICSGCGAKINAATIPAGGHQYVTHETPASCKSTGVRYEECGVCKKRINSVTLPKTEHRWGGMGGQDPTCTTSGYHYQECLDCGAASAGQRLERLGHAFAVTEEKAATCTEAGYQVKTCTRCGQEETTVTQPAKGHSYGAPQHVRSATCQQEGETTYTCTVCGDSKTNTVPKSDHHWVLHEDRQGLKECRDCGKQY